MDIGSVRSAMATKLAGLDAGVNEYASVNPTAPGVQILPPGVEYDRAMHRGLDEWTFTIQAFVSFSEEISAQQNLDAMCNPSGSQSIKALLEADPTLNGTVQNLRVMRQSQGAQHITLGGQPMLLVEFEVQVFAVGT